MDVCAKCGVIVEPGEVNSLRACKQPDGRLFCICCDQEAVWTFTAKQSAVQPVQRRVA